MEFSIFQGEITRTKSVWNSSKTKSTSSSSNWWDLGAGPELKDLAEETLAGGMKLFIVV